MRNKDFYDLFMDFEKLRNNGFSPCDIDMYYKFRDGFIVIGEAKLAGYGLNEFHEKVLTHIIDNHAGGGILLLIEHNQRVQDGDTSVNIAECMVAREYYDGLWHEPNMPDTVLERLIELRNLHA